MTRTNQDCFTLLIDSISTLPEVQSIGKSGGAALPPQGGCEALPGAGESDVDVFVFCDAIPAPGQRRAAVERLGEAAGEAVIDVVGGRQWGYCDFVQVGGVEICLMYFTIDGMKAELEAVLNGERLEKEDNYFYPTGRCATFLSFHVLVEKGGFIAAMQKRLAVYPAGLAECLVAHHLRQLRDVEDLERAVARQDVLFYHFALDLALDHFLQALFALNRCFFPSRKRSLARLEAFAAKPEHCAERVLRAITLGGGAEGLAQSYALWSELCSELAGLASA